METIEKCKHMFTAAELTEISESLARKMHELDSKEDELKGIKSQFKSEIDTLKAEMGVLGSHIRNRYEYRDTVCRVDMDYGRGEVDFIRTDTGEVIRTRKMTPAEAQKSLELGGGDDA